MCTNETLKKHIRKYAELKTMIQALEKDLDKEKAFILSEMENRQAFELDGKKIVTERLSESVTKAGKEQLKTMFPDNIEMYINVSYSRFINTAAAKKF